MIDSSCITDIWRKVAPQAAVFQAGEEIDLFVWNGTIWQAVETLPEPTLLGKTILLVPEQECVFRQRSYPADLQGKDALFEAITLDAETWSPWGKGSQLYYWPAFDGGQWRVGVWAWNGQAKMERLPDDVCVTHMFPYTAWRIASLNELNEPTLAIWSNECGFDYAYVDRGAPLFFASIVDKADALRFWHSLGARAANIVRVALLVDETASARPWVPDLPCAAIEYKALSAALLKQAALPGIQEWTDPFVWRKPLLLLLLLCLMWQGGSSAILWQRQSDVQSKLDIMRVKAEDVLALRSRVNHMHDSLEQIGRLRLQQSLPLRLLGEIADKLPSDAWLVSIAYENARIDIRGWASKAATVGPLLENIGDINHVAYLEDIRQDADQQRESFYLRLHLTGIEY